MRKKIHNIYHVRFYYYPSNIGPTLIQHWLQVSSLVGCWYHVFPVGYYSSGRLTGAEPLLIAVAVRGSLANTSRHAAFDPRQTRDAEPMLV